MDETIDLDTTTEEVLLAASNHDLDTLRRLLKTASANVQDQDTGYTLLHAAIAACEADPEELPDGDAEGAVHGQALDEDAAVQTVKLLFENGAIWNDLDLNDETPGCLALRLGLKQVYDTIVEAGVRAELLLNRLDDFQMLGDGDEEEEEEEDEDEKGDEEKGQANGDQVEVPQLVEVSPDGGSVPIDVNSKDYLESDLIFSGDRLLDSDKNGVMMAWETDIMRQSAEQLVPETGRRILNIGHGMSIIDEIFQSKKPSTHHIVEAHPAVLQRMQTDGWSDKSGVMIHAGKWQDVIPELVQQGLVFDAIYFDTFAEDYKALQHFFSEHVITLLDTNGRFGFFNGLGADRQVCYDVYTKIVEMDLFEAGFDTRWTEIKIADLDASGEWEGVRRKYWALDTYRLPTCEFVK